MKLKNRTDDVMICLLLLMQLGFHTNTAYDDYVSIGFSIIVFLYFLLSKAKISVMHFTQNAKNYVIWYSLMMVWCGISFLWSEESNLNMIKNLVLFTYIPLMLTAFCVCEYLRRGNDGIRLLIAMITAEMLVGLRALIHTPLAELFTKFDTRLYGTGLGVNYNHFTTQFALVFVVVLFMAYNMNKMFYIPLPFLFANILVSGSRKVLLVSAIAFIILYLTQTDQKTSLLKRLKRILIIVVIISVPMWIIMTNEFMYKLIGEKTLVVISGMLNIDLGVSSDASTDQRRELIVIAGDVFQKNFFHGVGYYSFMNYNKWHVYAHNNYMELLADLGIVGFVLYYSFYIRQLFSYFKMNNCRKSEPFKLRIGTDFFRSKWNALGLTFFVTLMFMEYGQVTFFRPYVLTPLLIVTMAIENLKNKEILQRSDA